MSLINLLTFWQDLLALGYNLFDAHVNGYADSNQIHALSCNCIPEEWRNYEKAYDIHALDLS